MWHHIDLWSDTKGLIKKVLSTILHWIQWEVQGAQPVIEAVYKWSGKILPGSFSWWRNLPAATCTDIKTLRPWRVESSQLWNYTTEEGACTHTSACSADFLNLPGDRWQQFRSQPWLADRDHSLSRLCFPTGRCEDCGGGARWSLLKQSSKQHAVSTGAGNAEN